MQNKVVLTDRKDYKSFWSYWAWMQIEKNVNGRRGSINISDTSPTKLLQLWCLSMRASPLILDGILLWPNNLHSVQARFPFTLWTWFISVPLSKIKKGLQSLCSFSPRLQPTLFKWRVYFSWRDCSLPGFISMHGQSQVDSWYRLTDVI